VAAAVAVVGPVALAEASSRWLPATAPLCCPVEAWPCTRKAGRGLAAPNAVPLSGKAAATRRAARSSAAACWLAGQAEEVASWQPLEMGVAPTTVVSTFPAQAARRQAGLASESLASHPQTAARRAPRLRQTHRRCLLLPAPRRMGSWRVSLGSTVFSAAR
jgi:hypothetical protein